MRIYFLPRVLDFNPRPREEGDRHNSDNNECGGDFNPRPREEGDPCLCENCVIVLYFNPRPREEGDTSRPMRS